MLKKIGIIFVVAFNLFAIAYLVSPTPSIPDLANSVKSQEPGDTIQIPNVSGFYTNMTRTEVMNFYKAHYTSPFLVNINYPPEKSKTVIRDTIQSYYFEEFNIPFKESLYVNGFEWENDVFTKPEKRIKNKLIYNGKEYKAKITIRTFPVSIPKRLFSFFFTESIIIFGLATYKKMVFTKRKNG